MTDIQVKYWTHKETQRANLAKEGETALHNRNTEELQRQSLVETKRSNLADEAERYRHNLATENLGSAQLREQQRVNDSVITLNAAKAAESASAQERNKQQASLFQSQANRQDIWLERESAYKDVDDIYHVIGGATGIIGNIAKGLDALPIL